MTYPLSTDVTDGQPTSYLHYNNLRADATRFGQAAADVVTLGAGLARYVDNLVIEPLATNRVRVPYNSLKPCTLMIDGYLCQAAAAVDLASSTFSGVAATWYIFANRTASSTTFTLSANTSLTEAAGQRRIAAIVWDGANLDYESLFVYPGGRPSVYYAQVTRTAAQSIGNAAWTAISFDTEDVDTDLMYAAGTPTRITIVHPGLYIITGTVAWANNTTNSRGARLYLNGATIIAGMTNGTAAVAAGDHDAQTVTAIRYLNAGDYITLHAYQNTGGALNTGAPTTLTVAALSA